MTTPAEYTIANGGGTFRADTLMPVAPNVGYAVALAANDQTVQTFYGTTNAMMPAAITRALFQVREKFPDAPYVGTWLNEGVCHVDPVLILTGREDAIALGRALGQKAIWSFADGREVTL